jgi:hypothetical protein
MNAPFLSRIREPATPGDDFAAEPIPVLASQACCCPAKPVVRVVMPPTATRGHSVDLLLCGHHYRVSCQALAKAHAIVTELTEITGDSLPALLPDPPRPRVPAE